MGTDHPFDSGIGVVSMEALNVNVFMVVVVLGCHGCQKFVRLQPPRTKCCDTCGGRVNMYKNMPNNLHVGNIHF